MKTLKWFTICFVICCSSSVFAQCVVGIAPSISGEVGFCGSGVPANEALIGDTIVYSVLIETSGAACPISNAAAELTLPDGTVIPVPVSSDLPPGSSESFPCIASYVVMAGDLGQLAVDISPGGTDPTQPDEVRALITASGTADTGGGNTDEAQGAAVRTTTILSEPCFEVTKECLSGDVQLQDGDLAEYLITITNCGEVTLDYQVTDIQAPSADGLYGPQNPGDPAIEILVSIPVQCGPEGNILNEVEVLAIGPDGAPVESTTEQPNPRYANAQCPCGNVGEEGCTPGFWKNHPDCWCDSYAPEMLVSDVWTALQDPNYASYSDSKCDFDTDTLMDALNYRGGRGLEGAVRNLLRHATAALLNGCNADVAFPISDALVIELGNAALASEDVDIIQELHSVVAEFNEYGCPINAHCELEYPEEPDGVIME